MFLRDTLYAKLESTLHFQPLSTQHINYNQADIPCLLRGTIAHKPAFDVSFVQSHTRVFNVSIFAFASDIRDQVHSRGSQT